MANQTDETPLQARLRELRRRQDELIALEEEAFLDWCDDVAALRVDSVIGLLQRLERLAFGGAAFQIDRRVEALQRAEEMVVDQLDREQLVQRLHEKRMTMRMCEYWLSRRRREVPTVNGYPLWLAATLVDVVD
jgi:hypothetical protein